MKKRRKMVAHVINIALVLFAVVLVEVTCVSGWFINKAYRETIQEELKASAQRLEDEYAFAYEGDWHLGDDGKLYKGDKVVSEDTEMVDKLKEELGLEYSMIFGKTRMVTTAVDARGERLVGTDVDADVANKVLSNGEDYFTTDLKVEGNDYYGYYIPVENPDGSIIGMIFVGKDVSVVNAAIRKVIMIIMANCLIFILVLKNLGNLLSKQVSNIMIELSDGLEALAQGNMNLNISDVAMKRRDELGVFSESATLLNEKLTDVIKSSQEIAHELKDAGIELSESANQATQASSQVTMAVEDISTGAASQADSLQNAAMNTEGISNSIDIILQSVHELNDDAGQMADTCNTSMDELDRLITSSAEVQASVLEIDNTIQSTNKSVQEISNFTQVITDIASQTNMLSLNAAIEAARAGESGKGFAVVAAEIGQLAVQTNESASEIQKIVAGLLTDSTNSVTVMKKLNEDFGNQSKQMDAMKEKMQGMSKNVQHVSDSTVHISDKVVALNKSKDELVDIIADLSAISQQNAAATEETNASVEELHATFSMIADSAAMLQELADSMAHTISYFRTEE